VRKDAPQARDRVREVHVARDPDALPAIQAFELGKELHVALHQVCELVEQAGALLGRGVGAPGGPEGLARRDDSRINICLLGVRDGRDRLAVRRVEDFEGG